MKHNCQRQYLNLNLLLLGIALATYNAEGISMPVPYIEGLKNIGLHKIAAYFPFENGADGYRLKQTAQPECVKDHQSICTQPLNVELSAQSLTRDVQEAQGSFQGRAMYFDSSSWILSTLLQEKQSSRVGKEITMAAWIKALPNNNQETGESFFIPIMSQSSTSTKEGRGIFFKSAASQKHEGTFVYASKVFDANLQEFFPSKTIIPHDKWTFIAVSYTSKDCLLFVDGSSATSPIKNAIFNDNINFGATSTSQFGFSGLIDEAIVLNEALSQAQLTILMMSSQYSSENIVSVHPAGFALSFAAEGTAVLSLGDSSSMSSLDAFTVSMWVKPVPSVDKRHMCLVTKGNLHHPEYAICLTYRIDMANDPTKKNAWRVTVALASSEETSAAELEDSNFLNAKWESIWHSKASLHIRQWSRLDIVWDGNICSIAVNNVVRDQVELDLRNTGKDSTSPLVVGGFASFKDSDLASINIGNLFQGEIDELYFWKYPLNVQQFGLRRIDPGLHIQEKLLFGYWAFNDGRGFLASNEVDVGKHWSLNFLSGNFSTSTLPKWVVSTVPLETSLNVDSENATPVRVFAADIEFETLTGTISTLPEGVNLFHSINEDNVSAAVDWSRPINTADEKFPVFRPEWSLDYYSAALSENVLAGTVSLWIVPRITDTNIASVLKYYVNQAQGAINIFVKASPPDSAIQLPKRIPMIYKGINLTDIDAEEEL